MMPTSTQSFLKNVKIGYEIPDAITPLLRTNAQMSSAAQAGLLSVSPLGVAVVRDSSQTNTSAVGCFVKKATSSAERILGVGAVQNTDATAVKSASFSIVRAGARVMLPMKTGETYLNGTEVSYDPTDEHFKPAIADEMVVGVVDYVVRDEVDNYQTTPVKKILCVVTLVENYIK